MKRKLLKYKKIIIGTLVVIMFIITSVIISNIISTKKLTLIEELTIKELNTKIVNYLEYIEYDGKELDKYIVYSLAYSCDNNKCSLTYNEIKNIINNTFSLKTTEEEIEKYGITPYMVEKNITTNPQEKTYTISEKKLSYEEISNKKIYHYILSNIEKNNANEFILTYDKYTISDPYKILEFYEKKNNEIENNINSTDDIREKENLEKKKVDTSILSNYLTGKENENSIKKYFNKKNVKEFSTNCNHFEITIILQDNKLVIQEKNSKQ